MNTASLVVGLLSFLSTTGITTTVVELGICRGRLSALLFCMLGVVCLFVDVVEVPFTLSHVILIYVS